MIKIATEYVREKLSLSKIASIYFLFVSHYHRGSVSRGWSSISEYCHCYGKSRRVFWQQERNLKLKHKNTVIKFFALNFSYIIFIYLFYFILFLPSFSVSTCLYVNQVFKLFVPWWFLCVLLKCYKLFKDYY